MLEIEILSLFPSYFESPLKESILKRAIQKGLLKVSPYDIRPYSKEPHQRVDDRVFGGGPGMVMMPEPVSEAIADHEKPHSKVIYMSPRGVPLTSELAKQLATESHLIILSGHYEGVDQRVIDEKVDLEVSIGDVVLTNGCLASLVLIDALVRFIPGVLGHEESSQQDSFEDGLWDCSHYTKPVVFHGQEVPPELRSGDHSKINLWRKQDQIDATKEMRPDLLLRALEFHSNIPEFIQFSRSIPEMKRWFKKYTDIEELTDMMGFSCDFGPVRLVFLPSCQSSSSIFSLRLTEKHFQNISKKVRAKIFESIVHDTPNELALIDPEGRILRFSIEC